MPKKKNKFKELDDNQRQQYKDNIAGIISNRDKRFDALFAVFGPDGKLPEGFNLSNEFNSIEVPLPEVEGMSPEDKKKLAAAIILGSMMNPDRLGKIMSSSSPNGDVVLFNQNFFVHNIIKGDIERQGNFPPIMVQAKNDAAEAIKNMNNGDPSAAKKMLDDFITYSARVTADLGVMISDEHKTAEDVYSPPISAMKLAFDHLGKEPLKAEGTSGDPVVDIQKKVGKQVSEAGDRVFDLKNRLITEDIPAGSDERKELVENLLFDEYLMNLSYAEVLQRREEREKYVEAIARKIGYGSDHELYEDMGRIRTSLENDVEGALKAGTVSDLQVILSKNNGYDKLKTLYMDSIRNSALYQKMVEAEGNKIIDVMKFADSEIKKKSFYEFADVRTGGVAKSINEKNKKKFNKALKEAENKFFNTFDDEMNKSGINAIDEEEYGINDFTTESLVRNGDVVDDMFDLVDKVDSKYIRSSKEFRDMKKSLVKFKEMAEKISILVRTPTPAELKKYNELLKKTDELAKAYLNNKTDSSSPYAKSRMTAVFELRRRLNANYKAINAIYSSYKKQKVEKIKTDNNIALGAMYTEVNNREYFNPVSDIKSDPYRQGAYKDKAMGKPDLCPYSTDRTATHSIALMKLAAEVNDKGKPKYTIDNLMHPYEFRAEKSRAYDETAKWILDYSNEGQQWIASNIYKGLKNLSTQIDDYAKKIDFTSKDYMKTPEYRKLQQLTFQLFDIGQEMEHCKSELLNIVNAEHPEITKFEQIYDMFAPLKGPLAAEGGYFSTIREQGDAFYQNIGVKDQMNFVNSVLAEGIIKKVMADAQEKNIPYTKIFSTVNQDKSFNMKLSMIGIEHMDLYDPDVIKYAGTKLLDGSICKDIKVTFDPTVEDFSQRYKVTGIPTAKQLKDDYFYECTAPDSLDAIAHKNAMIMQRISEKDKPEKKPYTTKASTAILNLRKYVTDPEGITAENKKDVMKYIRDIVAEKSYDIFVKDGLKGEELKTALDRSLANAPELKALEDGYLGKGDVGAVLFEDGAKKLALGVTKNAYNMMADDAITRLNAGNYLSNEDLLKDASIAITGKLYQETGKLPTNPKTKKPYTFKDYAKAISKEPSFKVTINKGNGLDESAKLFARIAGDSKQLKEMLAKTSVVAQNLQAQNVNKNVNKNVNVEQGMHK